MAKSCHGPVGSQPGGKPRGQWCQSHRVERRWRHQLEEEQGGARGDEACWGPWMQLEKCLKFCFEKLCEDGKGWKVIYKRGKAWILWCFVFLWRFRCFTWIRKKYNLVSCFWESRVEVECFSLCMHVYEYNNDHNNVDIMISKIIIILLSLFFLLFMGFDFYLKLLMWLPMFYFSWRFEV